MNVAPGSDGKWILLVEDNAYDEALTLRAFRKSGLESYVVVARDGVEALDYLLRTGQHADRGPGGTPRVILLDLRLPRLDGLEVLRQLRADERTSLLPEVILTSSDENKDIAECYRLGSNSYVCKPVSFTQFAEAVRNVSLYWLMFNQVPSRL